MQFQITREALLKPLLRCVMAIATKEVIPVIQTVKFEAGGEGLAGSGAVRLSSTNLEDGYYTLLSTVKTIKAGLACVCAPKRLAQLVRSFPDGTVITVTAVKQGSEPHQRDMVEVTANGSKYTFETMTPDGYPSLPTFGAPVALLAQSSRELAEVLARLRHAAATEESRYSLCGVMLRFEAGQLIAVATDGHRLAEWRQSSVENFSQLIPTGDAPPYTGKILLSNRSVRLVIDAFGKGKAQPMFLYLKENRVLFSTAAHVDSADNIGDQSVYCRMATMSYPDYEKVIPASGTYRAELSTDSAIAKLKRLALLADKRSHAVAVSFTPIGGPLTITTTATDSGVGSEEIPFTYSDDPKAASDAKIRVGYNVEFLLAFVKALPGGSTFTLNIIDEVSAALLTSNDVPGFREALMPMRLG
jgi:DNA polymerase III subunit beta